MTSGNNKTVMLDRAEKVTLGNWGKTLVVAPHPDDESLGCGGTIALLRQLGVAVEVVFTSDGSMSHPNSVQYPAARLAAVRQSEALSALQILGVAKGQVHFMGLKDSQVPALNDNGFETAVYEFTQLLKAIQPEIIFLPWRRDPHKDHRASWQIVNAARKEFVKPIRQLEYFIWLWERGESDELPQENEAKIIRVDISKTRQLKMNAVAQHLSQTTRLIADDTDGFLLSPAVISHFNTDFELFIEIT